MVTSTSPSSACARTSRPRSRRILGLVTLVALLAAAAASPPARAASSPTIAPEQKLVNLLNNKSVHAEPEIDSPTVAGVVDQRPLTLVRTSLPVLERTTDASGRRWLRVRLPGYVFDRKRPPSSGWITAHDTQPTATTWHLVVDRPTRRVLAYREGELVREFKVIVGKPSTPTPSGKYFIEESLRLPASHLVAPAALATSARSNVFETFLGGLPQVALHGVANIGGKMGTAVSNGCIRMTSTAILWLRKRIRPGVPLTIK